MLSRSHRSNQSAGFFIALKQVAAKSLGLGMIVCLAAHSGFAIQAGSTTTVNISPGPTVNAGSVVTLTASVTEEGSPITKGSVIFCSSDLGCAGVGVLGHAQLTSNGTATWKFVPGVGIYHIQAEFQGLGGADPSTSTSQSLVVLGTSSYASFTALAASGTAGDYDLTAMVEAFGLPTPTGTVSFVDTSNGNSVLASVAFDPGSLNSGFTPAIGSPLSGGKGSYSVAAGDFDGDGVPDLALVNSGDNNIGILLGKGNGTFQSSVVYATGSLPKSVAVGDFNSDGFLDLAVANSGSSTVSILLGNGDGTFQGQVTYPTGNAPESIAVADLDRDGNLDLVVANTLDGTVSALLGNRDGTFQPQSSFSVGNGPMDVALCDFNGDGILDIAVANSDDNTVGVLLGNGDGTFTSVVAYPAGDDPDGVLAGDFNGDGIADLAVANFDDGTLGILLGQGGGNFDALSTYPAGATPTRMAPGDFNGDGILDIAVPNSSPATLTIMYGKGDGSFHAQPAYAVGNQPMATAVADVNGDGLSDLAVINDSQGGSGSTSILLGERTIGAIATGLGFSGAGTHNIVAEYPGDTSHAGSQSSPIPLSGSLLPTTTTLSTSSSSAFYGSAVTFTATVTPTPSGLQPGTVSFFSGSTLLGTVAPEGGTAALTTSTLSGGSDSITASYSGDASLAASTSAALRESIGALFTIAVPSTPLTVGVGSAGSATVRVTPVGGAFDGPIVMSVSGLPSNVVATFTPAAVTPHAAPVRTAMSLTLQSSQQASSPPAPRGSRNPLVPLTMLAGCLLLAKKRKGLPGFVSTLAFTMILGGTLGLTGCAGGTGIESVPPTQGQTYTITILGSSGSLQRGATMLLTVQ